MGSYVQGTLLGDEKVIGEGKLSLWSLSGKIVLGLIAIAIGFASHWFFIIGLLFLLMAFLRYTSTDLAFTNKRVVAKFGIISRRTIELNLKKVESLQIRQGILGRLFNYGTIVISGAGNPQAPIPGISDPMTFRKSFMEFQDKQNND